MVEEFIGIMVASIIVMRPCFHMAAQKVAGAIATLVPSTAARSTTLTPTGKLRTLSRAMGSQKGRGDREGFNIMETTDIEMQSHNQSAEGISGEV